MAGTIDCIESLSRCEALIAISTGKAVVPAARMDIHCSSPPRAVPSRLGTERPREFFITSLWH